MKVTDDLKRRPVFDVNSLLGEAQNHTETPIKAGVEMSHDAAGTGPRSFGAPRGDDNSNDSPGVAPERSDDHQTAAEDLIDRRRTTHGIFEDNAIVSQMLKDIFRSFPGWHRLSAIERESMDMIALKFSRILSGRSMEKQHWEDVVGYARLVEEKCF